MEGSRPLIAGRRQGRGGLLSRASGRDRPQLRYMWAPVSASVAVVKYQYAFAVHNRPLGDKPWGQFSFPLQARRRATAAHPVGTT